jgi:hypothetical protein
MKEIIILSRKRDPALSILKAAIIEHPFCRARDFSE